MENVKIHLFMRVVLNYKPAFIRGEMRLCLIFGPMLRDPSSGQI